MGVPPYRYPHLDAEESPPLVPGSADSAPNSWPAASTPANGSGPLISNLSGSSLNRSPRSVVRSTRGSLPSAQASPMPAPQFCSATFFRRSSDSANLPLLLASQFRAPAARVLGYRPPQCAAAASAFQAWIPITCRLALRSLFCSARSGLRPERGRHDPSTGTPLRWGATVARTDRCTHHVGALWGAMGPLCVLMTLPRNLKVLCLDILTTR
jgi:hypothetical protein